ncbi:Calmodulin-Regulated Spectrin-Associated Protein 2 [Manis pentadactyla]|nr:Calmodulin-Regulated Spectrin-Associated Protein 2 [Manis pentadactyla]
MSRRSRRSASQKAPRPRRPLQLKEAPSNRRLRPVRTLGRARGGLGISLPISRSLPEPVSLGGPQRAARGRRADESLAV